MKDEFELELQAYFDGELSEKDARAVEVRLAADENSIALLGELRNTRLALKTFEAGIKLPESREFYWSKIERQIRASEATAPRRETSKTSWLGALLLRRAPISLGTFAILMVAGLLAIKQTGTFSSKPMEMSGASLETVLLDSGAVTYRDHQAGMTVVWLPYPAEN